MLRGLPHRQLNQYAPDDLMDEMQKHMEDKTIPKF
ncbi:unnamed protein product, partial [Didymodactylos carnosus]